MIANEHYAQQLQFTVSTVHNIVGVTTLYETTTSNWEKVQEMSGEGRT